MTRAPRPLATSIALTALTAACGLDLVGLDARPDASVDAAPTPPAPAEAAAPPTIVAPECRAGEVIFAGHCYFLTKPGDRESVNLACASANAHLVAITSQEEQTFVETLADDGRWIGMVADDATTLRWLDGEGVTYQNWYPNNPASYAKCVAMENGTPFDFRHRWVSEQCSAQHPGLCERG